MVKKLQKTASSRKWAYKSFRDHVDSIKIDPLKDVKRKAFHDAEISHFLSTLEHWREVNLSKNFQELVEVVEPISMTLPQLLYHKDKIFNALDKTLSYNDPLSLQPTLELLSQFYHDLGPDAMDYYKRTLEIVREVSLNHQDPQSLEFIFNTLAYIFKYLSKILSADITMTFTALLPLLTVKNKDYITRFTSEAISFLIRKAKMSNLQAFFEYIFKSPALVEDDSESYHLGLTIMFSEAFKSASGVLHSKTGLILPLLTKTCLRSPKSTSVLSDIIMDLLDYTQTKENSSVLYTTLTDAIKKDIKTKDILDYEYLTSVTQLLLTLSFGESGRRVPDWNILLQFIDTLYDASLLVKESIDELEVEKEIHEEKKSEEEVRDLKLDFLNSMASWCSIVIRNSDTSALLKYHVNIIRVMSKLDDGSNFLPFIDTAIELNRERTLQFTKNSITSFIGHHWQENYKEIAFFLERLGEKNLIDPTSGFNVIISSDFKSFILESFKNIQSIENKNALINNYWRLLILKHCTITFDPEMLIKFLSLLQSSSLDLDFFILDVFGATIGALTSQKLSDNQSLQILKLTLNDFDNLIESTILLSNFNKFVSSLESSNSVSIDFIKENKGKLLLSLSKILKSPSHDTRETALNLIISIFDKSGEETPDAILQCRTIEQVPLTLQHARDVPLRFKNLAQNYSTESALTNNIVCNFLFGQLSNKFSPSWQGVQEFLVKVINQVSDLVWDLALEFISMNYGALQEKPYLDYDFGNFNIKSDISDWLPQDSRLYTILSNFEKETYHKYENVNFSLIEFSESKKKSSLPTDFVRFQVIKLLNKIPQVAEKNFIDLLPFVLNEDSDDVGDAQTGSPLEGWTMADRNGLIELMTHFSDLKSVPSADKIKEFLFVVLMDRQTEMQKLALDCLLNFKNPIYLKYQNHLKNLLDDTLFRDEIVLFLQDTDKSTIEANDVPVLLPLVLRILFGRAQTLKTNSTKTGRKVAAIKSLNNMNDTYVTQFLQLTFCKFDLTSFEKTGIVQKEEITRKLLKNINGFINMNLEVSETLGRIHSQCLTVLVVPLLFALSAVETAIVNGELIGDNAIEKAARNGRKSGFKLLYQLTQYLGDSYDWKPYGEIIYRNLVQSKMAKFGEENLSSASFLMKIMTKLWCTPERLFLLCMDDYAPIKALLSILPNPNAKDTVLVLILQLIQSLVNLPTKDDTIVELLTIVISECLDSLILIFDHSSNSEVNSLAIHVLFSFVSNDYVTDNDNRKILITSLTSALEKPSSQVDTSVKVDIVRMIASLIEDYDCSYNEILPVYSNIAKLYSTCQQSEMRNVVSTVFYGFGDRFSELESICQLIIDLNAYDSKNFREPDYDRRLQAFARINEEEYSKLTTVEWIPILYTCMFFINDENDQSLRSSATYTFTRYIDGFSEKSQDDALKYVNQMKDLLIPTLRSGLKRKNELVRSEYVRVLDHIVGHVKYYTDFDDMKVLLRYDEEDEESDFFEDIIHLQTYRRQKSLRSLSKLASRLNADSIAHYILPIVEHYAFWTEEKYRNVANDTISAVKQLTQHVSWNQFRAILTRYISIMNTSKAKEQTEKLRDSILLIVAMSSAMREWTVETSFRPTDYPKNEKIDTFVVSETIPKLQKIISVRDEETVVVRVPLSEALISLIMCCSEQKIDSELPGLLTNICQILRARSENLRDSVRKHLGRIAIFLGPHYLKFIIKELKGALTRGPQIHILSFTIHYLLTVMSPYLEHGSLGDSAGMIMECIMNDIFGEASEEKEATGYSSKTKEIKHNKSYDTGEIIASNIYLKDFNHLLTPVRFLLNERLSFKSQAKLEQLIKRFTQGLNKNEESSSTDILILCNEIYNQATDVVKFKKDKKQHVIDEKTERFLVQLDRRVQKTQTEYSLYVSILQQFSFDILKTAISRNDNLFKANYLAPFVPLLRTSLSSEDEGVVISSLKVLNMLVRLEFAPEVSSEITEAAGDVLKIIQDMPNTNNDLSQNCLRFLSNVIRFKDDLELKDSAISYILKKIEPDLDSPERQGTAFGFIKSLMFKNIMIPEIYDCMDIVSKLMVTSTTSEIRQAARSAFYTFLMEYDQSRGRLEKQFKLVINNLKYPAQAGRLSVLEFILTIVRKSSKELLSKLTTSFFIALANVSVTDDNPRCRESASEILGLMFQKLVDTSMDLDFIEKYTSAWLSQDKKVLLVRCALNVYKIYINFVGFSKSPKLDDLALERIEKTLKLARRADYGVDDENAENESEISNVEAEWQMVYSCLSVFEALSGKTNVFERKYSGIWVDVIGTMLYPHSWIRLVSSRLIFKLLKEIVDNDGKNVEFEVSDVIIQTIAYRTFRQLGAPKISEKLALQSVANLVCVSKKWDKENTKFVSFKKDQNNDESGDEDEHKNGKKTFVNAFDWALNRCAAILRNDSKDITEMMVTKSAIISYCEFLTSFLSVDKLKEALSETLLIPLLHISEYEIAENEDQEKALPTLATACLAKLSKKIGISDYNVLLANAMKVIQQRRYERKTRRAQLTLNNPEVAARRKLKKHFKGREKRRSNKDENGYYKPKRRKF